jgi:hypothetical protein
MQEQTKLVWVARDLILPLLPPTTVSERAWRRQWWRRGSHKVVEELKQTVLVLEEQRFELLAR